MRLGRPKDNLDYANPRGRPSIIAVWQHNLLVSKNAEIIIFSSPLCFSSPQDRGGCSAVRESFATRAQPSAKRSCPRKSPSRGSSQGGSDPPPRSAASCDLSQTWPGFLPRWAADRWPKKKPRHLSSLSLSFSRSPLSCPSSPPPGFTLFPPSFYSPFLLLTQQITPAEHDSTPPTPDIHAICARVSETQSSPSIRRAVYPAA